jgi:hypothetical protein
MNTLTLNVRTMSYAILSLLSKRGLIRPLVPTKKVARCRSSCGTVGTLYVSGKGHGTHKLISVRCTTGPIRMNSHADNEEFILISPQAAAFSPLYMIIGLHKKAVIERKVRQKRLTARDFMVVRLVYNDPRISVFTMLKDTPHFEIAGRSRRQAPIFFVAEPSRLKMHVLDLAGYRLSIRGKQVK